MPSCLSFSPKHLDIPWGRVILNSCLFIYFRSLCIGSSSAFFSRNYILPLDLKSDEDVMVSQQQYCSNCCLEKFDLCNRNLMNFPQTIFLYFLLLLFRDTASIILLSKIEILESYLISFSVTPYTHLSGPINFFLKMHLISFYFLFQYASKVSFSMNNTIQSLVIQRGGKS